MCSVQTPSTINMTESKDDFIANYLKRINDLENPLPLDSKIFLAERCVQPGTQDDVVRKEVRLTPALFREDKDRLRAQYSRCVESPATSTLDTFSSNTLTEVLEGKGWIVPHLLRSADINQPC